MSSLRCTVIIIIIYIYMYSLVQYSDMNEEMRVEAMELCVTACEKHASSNEVTPTHHHITSHHA